jgi:hypothetical protein
MSVPIIRHRPGSLARPHGHSTETRAESGRGAVGAHQGGQTAYARRLIPGCGAPQAGQIEACCPLPLLPLGPGRGLRRGELVGSALQGAPGHRRRSAPALTQRRWHRHPGRQHRRRARIGQHRRAGPVHRRHIAAVPGVCGPVSLAQPVRRRARGGGLMALGRPVGRLAAERISAAVPAISEQTANPAYGNDRLRYFVSLAVSACGPWLRDAVKLYTGS